MYDVLIADDEPAICEGLQLIIDWSKYGFNNPVTARNGKDALDKLNNSSYQLVITDIRMPIIDGIQLIKIIRNENPWIKIIIISGYSDFSYAKKALEYEVRGYLLKPVDTEEFISYIVRLKEELDKDSTIRDFQEARSIEIDSKSLTIINQIKTYIDKNFCEDLSLKSISAQFFINSAYLGQLFKSTFGTSFNDYLNKKKISEAKRILMTMDGNKIGVIINNLGYNNPEYFYRQFKRYEGISVAKYREDLKNAMKG